MKKLMLLLTSILSFCLIILPLFIVSAEEQKKVVLDNCDTFANQQTVKYVDYDEFVEGNGALRSLTSLNPTIKLSLNASVGEIAFDNAYLNFYLYVDDVIYSNGNAKITVLTANGEYTSTVIRNAKNGWNFYSIKISDMQWQSTDWNSIKGFEIQWNCFKSQGHTDVKTDTFIRLDNLFVSEGLVTVTEITVKKGTFSDMPMRSL